MGMIIGYIVRVITFPGLIFEAFVIKKTCELMSLEVVKVNYFAIEANDLPVNHQIPEEYSKSFGIAIFPFIVMSLMSVLLFYIGIVFLPIVNGLFIWLGISIAAHSFPETTIGSLLWGKSLTEIKEGNYIAIIGIPLVIVIFIAQLLHIFWLDVLYGLLLYHLVDSAVLVG